MNGWLNIFKPKGITSFDVVRKIKSNLRSHLGPIALKKLKIGHGGTLDPMAEGVLPIALGRATKTIYRFNDAKKTYQFEVLWGVATDTYDLEGTITDKNDSVPLREDIEAVLPLFTGLIDQTPPKFSACKIQGKPAYERARKGEEFELASKKVMIESLSLIEHASNKTSFEVLCGKGTYIRSLCRDIALQLNVLGTVSILKRLHVGPFYAENAELLEAIDYSKLMPITALFDAIYELNDQEFEDIRHGRYISIADHFAENQDICCIYNNETAALAYCDDGLLKPKNVFV